MTQTLSRTILFADLRGSTNLYESLGNAVATAVVTQTVSLLAGVVASWNGVVVKTLGDGLMAMFESPSTAIKAAGDMHDALHRVGKPGGNDAHGQAMRALRLQVGLAHGEVVEIDGDYFGDAVNVAARLLDHAGDNETLLTATVLDGLGGSDRGRFRSLDKLQLRGRAEPVWVHLMEAHRFGDTATTAYGHLPLEAEPEGIRLVWLDLSRIFSTQRLPVVLGRSPQATYCIDDSRVSRSHARIDWHGGAFQLTDLSYNGSYVRFSNDPAIISLRRGACTLHGSGVIGLGSSPADPTAPCVRFEVLKFSDTEPQAVVAY